MRACSKPCVRQEAGKLIGHEIHFSSSRAEFFFTEPGGDVSLSADGCFKPLCFAA